MEPSTTLIHPQGRAARGPIAPTAAASDRGELALGRYRLLERLGAGGFGVVWRAHDEQLGREVALKRIPLPSRQDGERATREALAGARLSHPAIVSLYEACAEGETFYLISELVHGRTLARLIAEDDLDDEQIVEVGAALAGALAHAHARGVIHRDVKPQNVIVPDEPAERGAVAKLADFGGAWLEGEDVLTRTGDVLGTLAYMAPEQSEGRELGRPVDVYALGLVLYEALSGVNPVRGPTPASTARRIGRRVTPLQRRRGDLRRELTRAIDAALEPDPRQRAPLDELAQAIELALESGVYQRRALPKRGPARAYTRARGTPVAQMHTPIPSPPSPQAVEPPPEEEPPARHRSLPRVAWFLLVGGLGAWQAALGRPGVSLLIAAAGLPLLVLRRPSLGWLVGAAAPGLGMLGLAAAYPAIAGQLRRWPQRAGVAVLGLWWMTLAEPLLGRRLWEGPPAGLPGRAVWEGSLQLSATHAIGSALTPQLLVGALVWACAAAVLPWVVRGRSAGLDTAAALTWSVALLCAVPLLERSGMAHSAHPAPRGALLGTVLACVLAVCARALRGPVCP